MSQPATGKNGKKNCLVIGRRREKRRRVAIEVLPNGPGDWMIVKEKKPRIRSSRYWKSYIVQR
jgi:hypothetical protein